MLLSKVYSHVLTSFIHGVLQNIDTLFFRHLLCSGAGGMSMWNGDTWTMPVTIPAWWEAPTTGISASQYLHVLCFVSRMHVLEHSLSSAEHIIVSSGISASYAVHKRQCFKNSLWSDIEAENEFFCCLHSCCLQTLMLSRAEISNAENNHIIKRLLFFFAKCK